MSEGEKEIGKFGRSVFQGLKIFIVEILWQEEVWFLGVKIILYLNEVVKSIG